MNERAQNEARKKRSASIALKKNMRIVLKVQKMNSRTSLGNFFLLALLLLEVE